MSICFGNVVNSLADGFNQRRIVYQTQCGIIHHHKIHGLVTIVGSQLHSSLRLVVHYLLNLLLLAFGMESLTE